MSSLALDLDVDLYNVVHVALHINPKSSQSSHNKFNAAQTLAYDRSILVYPTLCIAVISKLAVKDGLFSSIALN